MRILHGRQRPHSPFPKTIREVGYTYKQFVTKSHKNCKLKHPHLTKVLDYKMIQNKERDNITIKLSRRAKCCLTIMRVDTFLPSISNSSFFTVDSFLRSMYGWVIAEIIILLFYARKQFLLRTGPHTRAEQQMCSPYCQGRH